MRRSVRSRNPTNRTCQLASEGCWGLLQKLVINNDEIVDFVVVYDQFLLGEIANRLPR
jgi:hypothetical protein